MAKKVVATLKKEGSTIKYAKVIKAVKTASGSYAFKEEIVTEESLQQALKK